MGRVFVVELEGRSYRCKFCKTHLALSDDLVSRVLFLILFLFNFHNFFIFYFYLLILAILKMIEHGNSLCTLLLNQSWTYVWFCSESIMIHGKVDILFLNQ
jgi:hypothetical protein